MSGSSLSWKLRKALLVHTDLYLDNLHHVSLSYPFAVIDASINADTDTDAVSRCGQDLIKN